VGCVAQGCCAVHSVHELLQGQCVCGNKRMRSVQLCVAQGCCAVHSVHELLQAQCVCGFNTSMRSVQLLRIDKLKVEAVRRSRIRCACKMLQQPKKLRRLRNICNQLSRSQPACPFKQNKRAQVRLLQVGMQIMCNNCVKRSLPKLQLQRWLGRQSGCRHHGHSGPSACEGSVKQLVSRSRCLRLQLRAGLLRG
jgi:hypothetical protein